MTSSKMKYNLVAAYHARPRKVILLQQIFKTGALWNLSRLLQFLNLLQHFLYIYLYKLWVVFYQFMLHLVPIIQLLEFIDTEVVQLINHLFLHYLQVICLLFKSQQLFGCNLLHGFYRILQHIVNLLPYHKLHQHQCLQQY